MMYQEGRKYMSNLTQSELDKYYMQEALKEAKQAYDTFEVPVGCVVVYQDKIIGRGHNKRSQNQSVFSHAEVIAIQEACQTLDSWRLDEAAIYVTLEPCLMCAGAIIQSRIKRLVYAAKEPKFGVHQSQTNVFDIPFNHQVEVISGVLEEESSQMMKAFFREMRDKTR